MRKIILLLVAVLFSNTIVLASSGGNYIYVHCESADKKSVFDLVGQTEQHIGGSGSPVGPNIPGKGWFNENLIPCQSNWTTSTVNDVTSTANKGLITEMLVKRADGNNEATFKVGWGFNAWLPTVFVHGVQLACTDYSGFMVPLTKSCSNLNLSMVQHLSCPNLGWQICVSQ